MDLPQYLNAFINSALFQAGKKNKKNWPEVGCFTFALFILPRYLILDIDQDNTSSKFHSVFVSFILHSCMKLMANKLYPLPCKVPEKFIKGCGEYLIILVLHVPFVSHGCVFKIHVIAA